MPHAEREPEESEAVEEVIPEAKEEAEEAEIASIPLNSLQLPEVVDWEDGQEYELRMRVRQENKRVEEDLTAADFKIIEVKSIPPTKPAEEEEVEEEEEI